MFVEICWWIFSLCFRHVNAWLTRRNGIKVCSLVGSRFARLAVKKFLSSNYVTVF
ncbi:hypothetical protein Scep_000738 [Stephania cephalantha]|uniref:Uncharacterized protein n=1 Tax=Stephania cephalantha TaxID=152367 RepID=A0AAP0Q2Q1_9MAGN